METIFDLPAHTLFIHFPLVAIPLVSTAAVALGVRRSWPSWYPWAVLGAAVVTAFATWLAVSSGQAFDDLLDGKAPSEKHESLGQATFVLVLGLTTAIGALVGVRAKASERRVIILGLSAVTIVLAGLATVWVVRTGHEGARITWSSVVPQDAGS